MSYSLLSSSWYRVAQLKPRLREQAIIHRQRFRKTVWYVLEDRQNGKFHRLSAGANLAVALMDGRRTMEEIWDGVGQRAGNDPPTQDEIILLLSQLHSSDLLQGELPPDLAELAERAEKTARSNVVSRLKNPLALRIPVWDPDRFLDATVFLARPFFNWFGLAVWVALCVVGIVLAAQNWGQLQVAASSQLLNAGNLALIALTYPVIKALHEAGHAYATKVFGGHVHEFGFMLLILVPAPYVDATAATAFANKWQRIVVSAAGIMVETGLAALAMLFWLNAEPGLAKEMAFNVMLIGGVSTLLFNGNPLLRFDGYYVLADFLEIPNLGTRANKYFFYLIQRYAFGLRFADNPSHERSERKWLFTYAIASFAYRVVLSLSIAMLVATRLFFVGAALALLTLFTTFVMPLLKGIKYLFTSPSLRTDRRRALTVTGTVIAGLFVLFGVLPLPYATVAQGIVWLPGEAEIRAGAAGVVTNVVSDAPDGVAAGTPLVTLEDPGIAARLRVIDARIAELNARYQATQFANRVQAAQILQQRDHLEAQKADLIERQSQLVATAPAKGHFVPLADNVGGSFIQQGRLLGYLLTDAEPVVRVVVPQSEVDLVRAATDGIEVRYSFAPDRTVAGRIIREVPTGQNDLPSLALAERAGGDIPIGHNADGTPVALERIFIIDVATERLPHELPYGARAYVRFTHAPEPLFQRIVRSVRQTLLRVFGV